MNPEVLVLLSGGVDSTACLDFFIEFGRKPCALFVDYGQEAREAERTAAAAVARHYGIEVLYVALAGARLKRAGMIPSRNHFLVGTALLERPVGVTVVALGLHAGTAYRDCGPEFVDSLQRTILAGGEDRLQISTPFLTWSKAEIYEYCHRRSVPLHLTYSCETASAPCGVCLSCKDRATLDARA
jgi:7-cyano-7-deazaguanine synthase